MLVNEKPPQIRKAPPSNLSSFKDLHTPVPRPSATCTFQGVCTHFKKHRGYTPRKRIPGESSFPNWQISVVYRPQRRSITRLRGGRRRCGERTKGSAGQETVYEATAGGYVCGCDALFMRECVRAGYGQEGDGAGSGRRDQR